MQMNIVKLRRLIREEVERQLDGELSENAVATFEDFRVWLGERLSEARAPRDLVKVVYDVGNVTNPFVSALWETWSDLRLEGSESDNWEVMMEFAKKFPDVRNDAGLTENVIRRMLA